MDTLRLVAAAASALVTTLLLSSCASVDASYNEAAPYPSSWASLQTPALADGCPDLSGTFSDSAVDSTTSTRTTPTSIANVVQQVLRATRMYWDGRLPEVKFPGPISLVKLTQTGDALSIEFLHPDDGTTSVTFYRFRWLANAPERIGRNFECHQFLEGPGLTLVGRIDRVSSSSLLGVGEDATQATLFRAADGSLVLRWQFQSFQATLFVVGTHKKNESVWLKFGPVRP